MAIINDGKHQWQEVFNSLSDYFLSNTSKETDYKNIYNDLKLLKDFIYDTIYDKLDKHKELSENEHNIRKLCKYVIGKMLPFINKKMLELERINLKEENIEMAKLLNDYIDLEDDFYAIASYRSLIHFAHYMERGDDKSQWVWKYNMNTTMGAVFYYSNAMILDHKYDNLIKQCPTGYG